MIPNRFVVEYPERCLDLLKILEPMAREKKLIASFSLLVAASAFVIPYERMQLRHPMHVKGRDGDLNRALRRLDEEPFLRAGFWNGAAPGDWRFSRIMGHANDTYHWLDENGRHPMSHEVANNLDTWDVRKVLRVIRNALAHGNVIYLNEEGFEMHGAEVRFLAFLARYEESEDQCAKATTYRLVVATEETFLKFIKVWTTWVASFRRDYSISDAAR